LPNSKLAFVNASHFTWEDASDEYAALVTDWWAQVSVKTPAVNSQL